LEAFGGIPKPANILTLSRWECTQSNLSADTSHFEIDRERNDTSILDWDEAFERSVSMIVVDEIGQIVVW